MLVGRSGLGLARPLLKSSALFKTRNAPAVFKSTLNTIITTENQEDSILAAQRVNRPVSPHLQIYQPQLTWYLSGLHRITGVFLAVGFYGITCTYAATSILGLEFDAAYIYQTIQELPLVVKYTAKAAIAYPFVFHFCNGIRHFIWDAGKEFTIKGIYRTGYTVLGAAGLLGTYLTFLS